jgi:hypothetical protein
MLLDHLDGNLNYCRTKVPFGVVEAVNGNIKTLLRRGRGHKNLDYLLLKPQRMAVTKTEFIVLQKAAQNARLYEFGVRPQLVYSEDDGFARTGLDVNVDDRFLEMAGSVKTGIAQLQRKLVLTLGTKTTVALKTGRMVRAFLLLLDVNLWVNFKRGHTTSPKGAGAIPMPSRSLPFP